MDNNFINNQSLPNCLTPPILKSSDTFRDSQNENLPSSQTVDLGSQTVQTEFVPTMPPNLINPEMLGPNPIIVMPAMLSVKQKAATAQRPKYMENPNMIDKNFRPVDEKEKNIPMKKLNTMKTPVNNSFGINYYKSGLEPSQGQRLVDLKKDREKQFYRNKALADIRLISQATVATRHKKQK